VVAALCGEAPERVRRRLAVLCQGHLLERVGTDRYQMHDLLRIYAAERARAEESDAERRDTVRRMLDWYLATAVAADAILAPGRYRAPLDTLDPPVPPPEFGTHREALAWCDTELANLVAAVRQASVGDEPVIGWQLSWSLWGYLELRKPWEAWLTTHRIGLACARQVGDRRAEAALLTSLGTAHYYPRRFAEALECYRPALAIRRELGDMRGQASLINNIGNVLLETRRLDEATEHFEQARTLHLAIDDRQGEAITLTNLAEACCLLGRYEEGLRHGQRSLELVRQTGNRRTETLALCQVANALVGLGRFDEAAAYFERALAGSRDIDDRQAEAWTLHYLAETAQARGEPAQARGYWRRAVELFDELGDPQAGDIRSRIDLHE
jgi:tetratricopeptide (TPR) repeat protein